MSLPSFQRLNKGDYAEAPPWFHRFLESINSTLDDVVTSMAYLREDENANCEYKKVQISDGVEQEIITSIKGRAIEVVPMSSDHYSTYTFKWSNQGQNGIKFTLTYTSAPTGKVWITLKIRGE